MHRQLDLLAAELAATLLPVEAAAVAELQEVEVKPVPMHLQALATLLLLWPHQPPRPSPREERLPWSSFVDSNELISQPLTCRTRHHTTAVTAISLSPSRIVLHHR